MATEHSGLTNRVPPTDEWDGGFLVGRYKYGLEWSSHFGMETFFGLGRPYMVATARPLPSPAHREPLGQHGRKSDFAELWRTLAWGRDNRLAALLKPQKQPSHIPLWGRDLGLPYDAETSV